MNNFICFAVCLAYVNMSEKVTSIKTPNPNIHKHGYMNITIAL